LILLNASERNACIVKELVVTDPTKNLEPVSIAPPAPAVENNTFALEPSLNVSKRIASPVVKPCPSTTTLLSVTFIVLRVIL